MEYTRSNGEEPSDLSTKESTAHDPLRDPLWLEPATWREVQAGLDHLVWGHDRDIQPLALLTACIASILDHVDPVLSQLCAETCPDCPDPCCRRATVRYDFRDLIFLHCAQWAVPLAHPKPRAGEWCALLDRTGCVLPRVLRPFLCTWYLCPWQMDRVRASPCPEVRRLPEALREIQAKRKELEEAFLGLIRP